MDVQVGGVTFRGDWDSATYTIERNGLTGWLVGGAAIDRESIKRPSQHGEFDTPGFLTGRLITLTGDVLSSSEADMVADLVALNGVLAAGVSGTMTVTIGGVATTATVRRSGEPTVDVTVFGRRARYQFRFWAPDPRRYGATHTFGPDGSVSDIEHDGNFPATPTLKVAGDSSGGYTVTGPGSKLITVTTALESGHPHTIDLATGGLYVDGSRVIGGMTVYQPWTVPAGGTVAASVSAGTLEVTVKDTYV